VPTSVEFTKLYHSLNEEQRTAVDSIEGPVMVLAGPGTGKTQTLAMRIANILQETQMDPWNILCLTFTESGVAAMRSRLLKIIGTAAYYVRIHTFHSFCNDIMQEHREWFAKSNDWQLISDAERIELFQDIINNLSSDSVLKPFYAPYLFFGDIMHNIRSLKQEDITPQTFRDIVTSLTTFVHDIDSISKDFFTLKVKDRTDSACSMFHDQLVAAATQANLPSSLIESIEYRFSEYRDAVQGADGVREQSKARTALKNSLKKWFEKQQQALPKQDEMAKVYAMYEESLVRIGRYDYEDMITLVVRELKANKDLLAECQEQFQFILVDEYQDTNGAQNEIVELLGSFDDSPNIFVVGDDKQSIYRFQGASLSNMLSFYNRYKEHVRVLSLHKNYRSQKNVIAAADAVIANNKESLAAHIPNIDAKQEAAANIPEEPLLHIQCDSEEEESYRIAQYITNLMKQGALPEDVAVLYRNNSDGESLMQVLRRLGVPARIEMGEDIFRSRVVRQWIMLFQWLVDGKNEGHMARILQYSWWDMSAVDSLKATHFASSHYIPLYNVLSSKQHLEDAGVSDPEPFLFLADRLAAWRAQSEELSLMEFLEEIVADSAWVKHALDGEKSVETLRAVKTLLEEAKKLTRTHPSWGLSDFVRHLAFLEGHGISLLTPEWEGGKGAVHLMTAHKAKGLEFPHVVIMRLNHKHWGGARSRSSVPLPEGLIRYDFVLASENNEDERRLFYVAVTRAMRSVLFTRATHSSTGKDTVPSLFLSEVPLHLVQEVPNNETLQEQEERLQRLLLSPIPTKTDADGEAYVRSLLTGYVMSVTHVNNYIDCPRKFYIRNIVRIPSVKNRSLAMGSAIHDTLRDVFERIQRGENIPNEEWVLATYEKHLTREALSAVDRKDALSRGKNALAGYIKTYRDSFATDVLLEHNFRQYHVQVAGVPLTGKLDKIEILSKEDKTVNVVDYKTGNSDNAWEKVRKGGDYFRQLVFYKLLCDNAPQFGYTMESGEIDFIEPSKKGYVKKRIKIDRNDVELLTEDISRIWKEIQELKFLDPANGCHKPECEYCN
jgi:DNA helicase II / ATP-dependent DNA helicase PcrA